MRFAILALAALAMIMLAGCSATSPNSILANLTPELQGVQERPDDVARNLAITNNANLRMLSNDIGRAFYTNHASRLSPYPIVSFSGNPF